MNFSGSEFVIDKKYAAELDTKVNVFRAETGTKKTLFPTMITTYGTRKNEHYLGRIQAEVVMEDLFASIYPVATELPVFRMNDILTRIRKGRHY